MRSRMLLAAVCLFPGLGVVAAPESLISVDLADVPFAQAVKAIADAGELKVVIGPLDPEPGRVTVSFANIGAQTALERLLRVQPHLMMEFVDDVIIIRAKPAATVDPGVGRATPAAPLPPRPQVTRPTPTVGGPSQPGIGAPSTGTGAPVLGTKRYTRIEVRYMYAPGLAEALGGRGLRLSDIDPWVGSMAASAGAGQSGFPQGQGSGLGGGGGNNGFGGGFGGNGRQSSGQAVFELPEGILELVGVDWGPGMIAR